MALPFVPGLLPPLGPHAIITLLSSLRRGGCRRRSFDALLVLLLLLLLLLVSFLGPRPSRCLS